MIYRDDGSWMRSNMAAMQISYMSWISPYVQLDHVHGLVIESSISAWGINGGHK